MTSVSQHRRIRHYYRHTERSFAHWGNGHGPGAGIDGPAWAMHYGFRDHPSESHAASLERMNAEVAERAKIDAGDLVLDAGCGVGSSALFLAEKRGARVHGVSLADSQIDLARRFAEQAGMAERARFHVADYEETGFAPSTFDVVWTMESLCHALDKQPFVVEAHRILKPRGRLVVADYFLTRDVIELEDAERFAVEKWTDGWVIQTPPTAPAFKSLLEDAGFAGVQVHDFTSAILGSSQEMFDRGKQGYPDDLIEKGVCLSQMRHVEACMFQKVALDLGSWRYLVFTAER